QDANAPIPKCLTFNSSSERKETSDESRLMNDLFSNYDASARPWINIDDIVTVTLKLTLTNLISLNEKLETLTTNVWILIEWNDYRLSWNESEYGGIDLVRVPHHMVWLPDIVLENNIDGNFEVAYYANVLVYSSGYMYWLPPAIFRSTCSIEVTYFPFDWQNCSLVFRSKTYNTNEIHMELATDPDTQTLIEWVDIDPEAFTENGEWAIKHRPARKILNPRFSPEDLEYQEIIFYLIIQRKPLFYIINVIVPCVLISSLGVLVYFLPAKAGGQKCTVSISVLLAQTVFLFLVAQKVPETSLSVPLIGKYLMFIMLVSTLIVLSCVIVLNVSLRTPSTHHLTTKLKHMLLEVLPRYLQMTVEPCEEAEETPRERRRSSLGIMLKAEEYVLKKPRSELMFERQRERHGMSRKPADRFDVGLTTTLYRNLAQCAPEIKDCVDACNFITLSTKSQNITGAEMENWIMIGKVLDVLCFWVMLPLFVVGTLAIFLMGHFNTAPDRPFQDDDRLYSP
uniref:Acetylcholine receptor subunit epsilon n=1 Tax=Leptobrachium leishanense TaxID=445787 RepID=A0A8C5PC65_9ANUR